VFEFICSSVDKFPLTGNVESGKFLETPDSLCKFFVLVIAQFFTGICIIAEIAKSYEIILTA